MIKSITIRAAINVLVRATKECGGNPAEIVLYLLAKFIYDDNVEEIYKTVRDSLDKYLEFGSDMKLRLPDGEEINPYTMPTYRESAR